MIPISDQDYMDAAAHLGCEVNAIKAVAQVESSGSGFLPTGEVVILFEPHIFWHQLQHQAIDPVKVLAANPNLSGILYEKWGTKPYGKPSQQWARLNLAAAVNRVAAFSSASFGKFQIMGFNATRSGYSGPIDMAGKYATGESEQLRGFVAFLLNSGMNRFLMVKDWVSFAKHYNGPGFRNNPSTIMDDYDYKLAQAYQGLTAS